MYDSNGQTPESFCKVLVVMYLIRAADIWAGAEVSLSCLRQPLES